MATPAASTGARVRSPGIKLAVAIVIALGLSIPLFAIYLLVYDRQSQSTTAETAIAQGWGGPQVIAGPVLVIPYEEQSTETVTQNGAPVQHTTLVARELTIAPDIADIAARIDPQRRHKSIYEAVVYQAAVSGTARFTLPPDLARSDIAVDQLHFDRATLRIGLADPRGLVGTPPAIVAGGRPLRLQPGGGLAATGNGGFSAPLDASAIRGTAIPVSFRLDFRGNRSLALAPNAGDTRWRVQSSWRDPSFGGGFLPVAYHPGDGGFSADWRVGNLALGKPLADPGRDQPMTASGAAAVSDAATQTLASVDLISPVDLYAEVNRSVKYGFLIIGFTFMAFLMFDVIGGVRVAAAEYLLVGVGLVLFFVMLLAFAEVVGFTAAYLVAGAAIIGLLSAYSAAVLHSWRRAGAIAALLTALYAVLYILLTLEAYSLLIGSLLLFAALAGIMYLTRRLDWSGIGATPSAATDETETHG